MDKLKDTTDWNAVDALTDTDIAKSVADDPEAAPLEAKGLKCLSLGGRPRKAITKQAITIRLQGNVIDFFKTGSKDGKGWQTRLSKVLEEYVEEHQAR